MPGPGPSELGGTVRAPWAARGPAGEPYRDLNRRLRLGARNGNMSGRPATEMQSKNILELGGHAHTQTQRRRSCKSLTDSDAVTVAGWRRARFALSRGTSECCPSFLSSTPCGFWTPLVSLPPHPATAPGPTGRTAVHRLKPRRSPGMTYNSTPRKKGLAPFPSATGDNHSPRPGPSFPIH